MAKARSLFESLLSRLDPAPPRQTPERRPIDWLAHGFGVLADVIRRQPINTAIQREEAMLRAAEAFRAQARAQSQAKKRKQRSGR